MNGWRNDFADGTKQFRGQHKKQIFVFCFWPLKDVVGPPYSIHDCEPKIGAVTGNTNVTLHGMGLAAMSGEASVMVACAKGTVEVPATVESDHLLTFVTPDYTGFGAAQDVQCRLKIAPKSYTNTAVGIKLFEVTDAAALAQCKEPCSPARGTRRQRSIWSSTPPRVLARGRR